MRNTDYKKIWGKVLWLTGMLILVSLAVIWYRIVEYNSDDYFTDNTTQNAKVSFQSVGSEEIADKWETQIRLSGNPDDFEIYTGATVSASIINSNSHDIKDWTLYLKIDDECYLYSFWCGGVTINQYRNGEKVSFTMDDRFTDLSTSGIETNNYSNTVMIHLQPGDEIVYIPSAREKEDIVKADNSVGIGFIFYFQDTFDLSSWRIEYHNDFRFINSIYARIMLILVLMWIGALAFYISLSSIEKKMEEQMNSQIRNISIMSDIYLEAFMVDISADSARLIKGERGNLIVDIEGKNVQETINNVVREKCLPAYQEELLKFFDFSTVAERMTGMTSITTEFVGVNIGWCAVRFFREEDNTNNIVITLQDINTEKKKLRLIEERINLAEYKQNVSGSFLGTVSFALNDISMKVGEYARDIMALSNQDNVKALADKVMVNTRHMNLIQNTMLDLYNVESQRLILNSHPYLLRDMLGELYHILASYAEGKKYKFSFEIDETIPEYLTGDSDRIEQILIILLFSSMLVTQQGFVTFSLFGKQIGDEEELIFSIRDSAGGFSKEQLNEIHEFINGSSIETFDNASLVYLKIINSILNCMNSELKIVSVLNEGTDFYFTLRQGISEKL